MTDSVMWASYRNRIASILSELVVTDCTGAEVPVDDAFAQWVAKATGMAAGGALHLVGNGASASMASHFSADITKNCGIRANVFTDVALITALGNDNGFENVFAVALNRYAMKGDLLIAVSSSGNSPNIVAVCREAMSLGVHIVTVTGKKPDNAVRRMGWLNFYVPAESFSLAESAHAVILHHWTDLLEDARKDIL